VDIFAEPDNTYDPHAVKVVVAGNQIGYLPKEVQWYARRGSGVGRVVQLDVKSEDGKYTKWVVEVQLAEGLVKRDGTIVR
jgi:hypothetical protein